MLFPHKVILLQTDSMGSVLSSALVHKRFQNHLVGHDWLKCNGVLAYDSPAAKKSLAEGDAEVAAAEESARQGARAAYNAAVVRASSCA